jgi:SNF2 family DNA or RNA helicase
MLCVHACMQATGVLSAITSLKKLCNHPKLIYDTLHSKAQVSSAVTLCSAILLFLSMAAVASCFPSGGITATANQLVYHTQVFQITAVLLLPSLTLLLLALLHRLMALWLRALRVSVSCSLPACLTTGVRGVARWLWAGSS